MAVAKSVIHDARIMTSSILVAITCRIQNKQVLGVGRPEQNLNSCNSTVIGSTHHVRA